MQKLGLSLLKSLGLAYWVTVTSTTQQRYSFGPFGSARHAVSQQEDCCQKLLAGGTLDLRDITSIRVSMEP